jgi:hypothetical protein
MNGTGVVEIHSGSTGTIIDNVQWLLSKPLIVNDNNHAQDVTGTSYQGWEQSGNTHQFGNIAAVSVAGLTGSFLTGVRVLKETGSYTGISADFSSPTAAPTQTIFTLTATGQAYTTPSTAPATGECVIIENSLASAPFILGVVTGSLTLDGTAYGTVASSLSLSPGQSEWICSDGSNYYSQQGIGVPSSTASGIGGILVPYESGTPATGLVTSNSPVCTVFNLYKRQLVTNITYDYTVGATGSTGDWGIYAGGHRAGGPGGIHRRGRDGCAASSGGLASDACPVGANREANQTRDYYGAP